LSRHKFNERDRTNYKNRSMILVGGLEVKVNIRNALKPEDVSRNYIK